MLLAMFSKFGYKFIRGNSSAENDFFLTKVYHSSALNPYDKGRVAEKTVLMVAKPPKGASVGNGRVDHRHSSNGSCLWRRHGLAKILTYRFATNQEESDDNLYASAFLNQRNLQAICGQGSLMVNDCAGCIRNQGGQARR
ncbi:hypothetical protein KIN20_028376 [Parelaphostrongylus tenuis]|uniref:Uncharacterized protein n=1 Tax=Parelaphostrongylus tenuis TaxID=148309 RepID=A0AAD5WES2_PARTN|nr:hypothetical protein KIN20_028376 [Parelaphostrongylus tenuis]